MAIMTQNYRLVRVQSFLDPFDDMSNTDYQWLINCATGRGEGTGVGYGESLQNWLTCPGRTLTFCWQLLARNLACGGANSPATTGPSHRKYVAV